MMAAEVSALTIANYNPAQHDRFASGYATSPTPNTSASFIGAGLDFSGVGWNPSVPTQSFAMISDEYFIYASHFAPSTQLSFFSPITSSVVNFGVDPNFTPVRATSTITGGQTTDLMVGRLANSVASAGITSYPILHVANRNGLVGLTALLYGHGGSDTASPRIGTNTIEGFVDYSVPASNVYGNTGILYTNGTGPTGEASFQNGDSGSPSFVVLNGSLVLLGNHSATATDGQGNSYSLDTYLAQYIQELADAGIPLIAVPVAVPEPTRAFLLIIGLFAAFCQRRRSAN
ncbi:MAG: PEP-CTERM sorting domain-containing protein [Roseimicrobium sp.]